MKYTCQTLFDITATGVTGHYKSSRVPFISNNNQEITDEESWNYARNQQRNWETITQLLSLRAQISYYDNPIHHDGYWNFTFEVETPDAYGTPDNPVKLLLDDTAGVPMLVNLDNRENLHPYLIVSGPDQNIWFNISTINN